MENTSDPWKQLSEEVESKTERIEQQQQSALSALEEQWSKRVETVLGTMVSDTDRLGEIARKHLSAIEETLLRNVATSQRRLVWVSTRGLLIAATTALLLAGADFWLAQRVTARWSEHQAAKQTLDELPQIALVNGKRYVRVSRSKVVRGKGGTFTVQAMGGTDGKSYFVELE